MINSTISTLSFWEEFKNSTILQAVLTILIWSAMIYMWIAKVPMPPELSSAGTLTLGFYFGSKVRAIQQTSQITQLQQLLQLQHQQHVLQLQELQERKVA